MDPKWIKFGSKAMPITATHIARMHHVGLPHAIGKKIRRTESALAQTVVKRGASVCAKY